jgi:hypothetical protein
MVVYLEHSDTLYDYTSHSARLPGLCIAVAGSSADDLQPSLTVLGYDRCQTPLFILINV